MGEFRVCADSNDLGAYFFKFVILLCQSSKLCCSDKSEVSRIEEEHGPLLGCFLSRKTDFSEISFCRIENLEFEIRNLLANLHCATIVGHDTPP